MLAFAVKPVRLFIGGPSQSGKSTTAQLICEQLGVEHVNLDRDATIIQIKKDFQGSERSQPLKSRCKSLLDDLKVPSVVEGSPLTPHDTAAIMRRDARFVSAFCGYPDIEPQEKLSQLEKAGFPQARHLRESTVEDRLERIKKYIRASQSFQRQCAECDVAFFDYSDLTNLDQSQQNMVHYFAHCIAKMPDQ